MKTTMRQWQSGRGCDRGGGSPRRLEPVGRERSEGWTRPTSCQGRHLEMVSGAPRGRLPVGEEREEKDQRKEEGVMVFSLGARNNRKESLIERIHVKI